LPPQATSALHAPRALFGDGVRIGTHAVPSCDTRSSLDWGRQSNNYFDFGKQTLSSFVAFGAGAPVVTGVTLLRDHHTQVHTLKVGINYLFGPAPVVAKYWARQGLSIGRSVAPATGGRGDDATSQLSFSVEVCPAGDR